MLQALHRPRPLHPLLAVADLQDRADLVDPQVGLVAVDMDIDPKYINIDISKEGLALWYRSTCFHLEKWPGGDPAEQRALVQMKDNLMRLILEQQFNN